MIIAPFQVPHEKEQMFEDDQIHFTQDSGMFFLENLMSKANEFFENPLININDVDMQEASTSKWR